MTMTEAEPATDRDRMLPGAWLLPRLIEKFGGLTLTGATVRSSGLVHIQLYETGRDAAEGYARAIGLTATPSEQLAEDGRTHWRWSGSIDGVRVEVVIITGTATTEPVSTT
jgi:hypothetical protein